VDKHDVIYVLVCRPRSHVAFNNILASLYLVPRTLYASSLFHAQSLLSGTEHEENEPTQRTYE
jgi:hypothetical protein